MPRSASCGEHLGSRATAKTAAAEPATLAADRYGITWALVMRGCTESCHRSFMMARGARGSTVA